MGDLRSVLFDGEKESMADIRYWISLAPCTVILVLFSEADVLSYLGPCCMEHVPHPIPPPK